MYLTDKERDALDTNGDGLPEVELDYFGARFYDSEIALFLTHDPQAQFDSPYSYTGGNPVNLIDPDGEFVVELLTAVIIGAIAGATTAAITGGNPLEGLWRGALSAGTFGLMDAIDQQNSRLFQGVQGKNPEYIEEDEGSSCRGCWLVAGAAAVGAAAGATAPKPTKEELLKATELTQTFIYFFFPIGGEINFLIRGIESGFKSLPTKAIKILGNARGAIGKGGIVRTLQTGGHTLSNSTLKELGLTKDQGKLAIEALKKDLVKSPGFHETKILSNGNVVHSHTGKVLGNLFDYLL